MSWDSTKKAVNLAATWPFRLTPHRVRRSNLLEDKFDSIAESFSDETNDKLRNLEANPFVNALGLYVTLDALFNGGDAITNPVTEFTDPFGNPYDAAGEAGKLVFEDWVGHMIYGEKADLFGAPFEFYGGLGDWVADPVEESIAAGVGAGNSAVDLFVPYAEGSVEFEKDQEVYDPIFDHLRDWIWEGSEYAGAAAAATAANQMGEVSDIGDLEPENIPADAEVSLDYQPEKDRYHLSIDGNEIEIGDEYGEQVGRLASLKAEGELEEEFQEVLEEL